MFGIELESVFWAAVVYTVLGAVWYSPFVFGRRWLRFAELRRHDLMGHWKAILFSFLAALTSSFILALLLANLGASTLYSGAVWGALAWMGFIAPTQLLEVLYYGRKWQLFFIDSGSQLLGFSVMGALLGHLNTPF